MSWLAADLAGHLFPSWELVSPDSRKVCLLDHVSPAQWAVVNVGGHWLCKSCFASLLAHTDANWRHLQGASELPR